MPNYVEETADLFEQLLQLERRGHGDTDAAMHRLSARHRLPKRLLWSLRYRTPKTLPWDFVEDLKAAYAATCRAQAERLLRQADKLGAAGGLNADRLGQVRALAARHQAQVQPSEPSQ
ncbi:hypothetical protein GCM10007036_13970 [Alsobacter metallidurans]|uniref:Uncharacterized protein n=1 Tax=Alsobacter metallidurans TaxID=340221 RepID=A0A917I5Z8_9HYPH|nr:hypothetical protein [Alsobacter metallidurans]GGH14568.1 hypothetical protein GCM10007036_13970 [Alsobacter metallidurans]